MIFQDIFIWSLLLSLGLSIIYRILTKPAEIRRIKEDVKVHREKMKALQKEGKQEDVNKALSEMMKLQQKQMKASMKPMIVSLLIFFVVLGVMREAFSTAAIQLPFTLPLISYSFPFVFLRDSIGWLWWYVLITIPFTFMFRKLLGVE